MLHNAIQQARDNIKENRGVTISGVVTTCISLTILGSFILIYLNLAQITQSFFQQSYYTIFLSKDITPTQKTTILDYLNRVWGIGDIRQISPEQAKSDLLKDFSEAQKILDKVELDNLPELIEFSLNRTTHLSGLEQDNISALKGVDELFFGRETQDQINTFFVILNFVGIFLIGLLVLSIMIIIKNSIQIALRIRIKEIEILKKIGATPNFIRLPYIIEGLFIALFGCIAAFGLIYFLYQFVVAGITFDESTYGIRDIVHFFSLEHILVSGFIIVLLGVFSAFFAANKIIGEIEN